MAANLGASILGMITGVLTARTLGPTARGDLAVLIFWPALVTGLFDAALTESVAIRVAEGVIAPTRVVKAATWVAAYSALLAVATTLITLPILLNDSQSHLLSDARWTLVFIPMSLLSCLPIGALQGLKRFRAMAGIRGATAVTYTVVLISLVASGTATVRSVAALSVGIRLLPAVLGAAVLFRSWAGPKITKTEVAGHGRDTFALQGARVAVVLVSNEDRMIASRLLSQGDIGMWQVPLAISVLMPFIATSYSQQIVAAAASAPCDAGPFVRKAYIRALLITGLAAAIGVLLLPVMVGPLYGSAFTPAIVPGIMVLVASIPGAAVLTLQASLRARMKVAACVRSEIAGGLAMAAVGIPATLQLGLVGLAAAYLAGRLVAAAAVIIAACADGIVTTRDVVPWTREFRVAVRSELATLWARASERPS